MTLLRKEEKGLGAIKNLGSQSILVLVFRNGTRIEAPTLKSAKKTFSFLSGRAIFL